MSKDTENTESFTAIEAIVWTTLGMFGGLFTIASVVIGYGLVSRIFT
ncbi:hypothetical protein [Roseibium aggregatum]|uniref:Uncharacterized protein n=1 Tax=Roseibium aggregatum TaxID=187304 RepID=A0A0M6YA98_9HYPH|nr:hypothetical protein [Roseibium aggregatum]CTQ45740.1 hypothetical protein LAL4801_04195 [Roseibium aggregatum]